MDLTKEANVKKEIKKILDKYKVFYFMPAASMYGKAGIPDFVCCVEGQFVGIEAKNSKVGWKGMSALQLHSRKQIHSSKGFYFVVYDEQTLMDLNIKIRDIIEHNKKYLKKYIFS